jgi:hypothetical protein
MLDYTKQVPEVKPVPDFSRAVGTIWERMSISSSLNRLYIAAGWR